VGLNVTLMVQLAPTERVSGVSGQVFVSAKSPLATIEVILSDAAPVFVSVTNCGVLGVGGVVTVWVPKVREAGKSVTAAAGTPVPLNRIVWGLFAALSVMVTDPYRVPVAVGVKVTEMVQFPPLATLAPHVLVSAKLALATMSVIFKGEPPMLVKVTDWAVLLVPTTVLGKVRLVGERLTAGPATPVPVNSTT
jgi:hypothetical protein